MTPRRFTRLIEAGESYTPLTHEELSAAEALADAYAEKHPDGADVQEFRDAHNEASVWEGTGIAPEHMEAALDHACLYYDDQYETPRDGTSRDSGMEPEEATSLVGWYRVEDRETAILLGQQPTTESGFDEIDITLGAGLALTDIDDETLASADDSGPRFHLFLDHIVDDDYDSWEGSLPAGRYPIGSGAVLYFPDEAAWAAEG